MKFLDANEDVVQWSSEETIIPYKSPLDNKYHRYFIDFFVKRKDGSIVLVEIKPYKQTQPPKGPAKRTRSYIYEASTYVVNQAKWKATEQYCLDRGYSFKIITERELYNNGH